MRLAPVVTLSPMALLKMVQRASETQLAVAALPATSPRVKSPPSPEKALPGRKPSTPRSVGLVVKSTAQPEAANSLVVSARPLEHDP